MVALDDESTQMVALLALDAGEVLHDEESTNLVENGYATWDGPLLVLTKSGEKTTAALNEKIFGEP